MSYSIVCIAHFSKDWATQYYYDVTDDEFYIAVEESRRDEARRCLERQFSPDVYKIVDPWQMSYQPGLAWPYQRACGQQIQMELFPGDGICNTSNMKCVLFSGSIINPQLGLTVAHAIKQGNQIAVEIESEDVALDQRTVGRCLETFEKLQRQDGKPLTADLALLELDTQRCTVGNTVWWPNRCSSRTLRIKFYKGQEIPEDVGVMIRDQNGYFRNGCIRRTRLCDGSLHDVIGICASETEEFAVTQPGDSGALVMSLPKSDDDFVCVYAISTGICRKPNGKSMTIANSLWKVVHEISASKKSKYVDGTVNIEFA